MRRFAAVDAHGARFGKNGFCVVRPKMPLRSAAA